MLVFLGWMTLTTLNAHYPQFAQEQLSKVVKIFLMIFVATLVINRRERLVALVWVIALSIGFYGVKGGIFTLVTGGAYRVQGPLGTFIGGNNELGLAMVVTVPLLYFCYQSTTRRWMRVGMLGAIALTIIAILGTQSRGALVGLCAMGLIFWIKSRHKWQIALLILFATVVAVPFMPDTWLERMSTIRTFEEDRSAQGRINAWQMAFNMARAEVMGGGFESFQALEFDKYAPLAALTFDAHSIYFEVLGEHGFPGLAIYLALAFVTWRGASKVMRTCTGNLDLRWLADLMAMTQVSLLAYLVAGSFLGMAYFDYYYNLVLIVVVATNIVASRAMELRLGSGQAGTPGRAHVGQREPAHGIGNAGGGSAPQHR
jgi:probable O-glycosylation ligase (exosortase A-associated)